MPSFHLEKTYMTQSYFSLLFSLTLSCRACVCFYLSIWERSVQAGHHDRQQIRGNDYQLGRIHTLHFVLIIFKYSLKCALCAQLLQVLWAGLCDRGGPQLHTLPLRLRAVPLGVAFRGKTCAPRCLCTAGPDIARTRILPRFPHPPNRPPTHAHTRIHTHTHTHTETTTGWSSGAAIKQILNDEHDETIQGF